MQILLWQKEFIYSEVKNLGQYLDMYVQSDTLLLSDVLENVRDMCL